MSQVAVLGLGIIGQIWARHYAEAGRLGATWNRTPKSDVPQSVTDLAEVPARATFLQLVVADPAAVSSVIAGLRPGLRAHHVVIQSSTIDPESSGTFQREVEATGARYLEAPFTGSKPAAEQRKTVFFLGGSAAVQAEVEPVLALLSSARLPIGTPQQACTLKLALNLNLAAQMEGLAEAWVLAREAGLSDDVFFGALQRNVGYSGLTALKEPKLRTGDFAPQFSVKHLLKDLRLATRMAGCREMPALDALREQLHRADQKGLGDEDFSAVVKLL